MALDGMLLNQLKNEINNIAEGARVEKIAQPLRDEIIIHIRWRGGNEKLLLSANASNPRIHFTENIPENPQNPPMFCMILRKYLSGAKLLNIRQLGTDRIIFIDFESKNDFGDTITLTLVQEIMGRHSNIILIDENSKILDSVRRVGFETSSVRQVLPNMQYALPPGQEKFDLLETDIPECIKHIQEGKDRLLSKALIATIQGMSQIPCMEVVYKTIVHDMQISELDSEDWVKLEKQLLELKQLLINNTGTPTILSELGGRLKDFSFLPVIQYGKAMDTSSYESYSKLLDNFYSKRDTSERIRQQSRDLHRLTTNTYERISRRIATQKEELLQTENRDELRIVGDILMTNLYSLQKGQTTAVLSNFYEEDNRDIKIELDIQKTPSENAQNYYSKYRKADTAEKMLKEQISLGEEELLYIESVLDSLKRSTTSVDLDSIREELVDAGYLKKYKKKKQKTPKQFPWKYISSDGFIIFSGRNNKQNDNLTLKSSDKNDIWLHTQKIPGSHTIIVTEGKDIPKSTLLEAGIIAAYHSKAKESQKVPVDYTFVRYVKKSPGAKAGMVIYDNFKTIFSDPNEELVLKLEKK